MCPHPPFIFGPHGEEITPNYTFEIADGSDLLKQISKDDPVVLSILREPDTNKPAAISRGAASSHPGCVRVMKTFVKVYARFASNVASFLIPKGGIYLAGGISGKNLELFVQDNLFITFFEQHCNPNILKVLEEIPIYVIKDYSISLYGAANAALSLMD